MSEQKNIPDLRFPEFDGEWTTQPMCEIGEFKNGINKSKEDFGFGVPFINLMDVFGKPVITFDNLGLVNANDKEKELYKLGKGDVLFIRSSVKKEGVGETSLVLDDKTDTIFSGFLIRFRDNKNPFDLHFKRYCFWTTKFRHSLIALSTTSANTNINQESLNQLEITFPSLPEQQKIASFFTAIDQKISQLKQKKTLLEQYKKGVMQKIFSQEIRFKDDNGKEFPKWEKKRLGDVCRINPTSETLPKEFIYIDLESVVKGSLIKEDTITDLEAPSRAQRVLMRKDILFQMVRPYQMNNFYFDLNGTYVASTGYAQIRTEENSLFIYHILHLRKFVNDVIERCTGTSYPAINSKDLSMISILIPSLPEQIKIANFLSAIDNRINQTQYQIEKTELWKKGLLQKMFV